MKYSVIITDKNYWDVYQGYYPNEEMIESGIFVEDRYEVVVEANNKDEAWKIAHEMFWDGEFDYSDSDYCLSKEGCDWWEDSQANPDSEWSKANDKYGDGLELDCGGTDYDVEEIK